MKVYIVSAGYEEERAIIGVYSKITLAKKCKEKKEKQNYDMIDGIDQIECPYVVISEWIVDKE